MLLEFLSSKIDTFVPKIASNLNSPVKTVKDFKFEETKFLTLEIVATMYNLPIFERQKFQFWWKFNLQNLVLMEMNSLDLGQ